MPYETIVAGNTITAAWANASVRDQVVTPFATSAARDSAITAPVEGMVAYLADTDAICVYNGSAWLTIHSAWQSYTPTMSWSGGGGSTGNATLAGRYRYSGGDIQTEFEMTWGSTSTTGTNRLQLSIPVGTAHASHSSFGVARAVDTSASDIYTVGVDLSAGLTNFNFTNAGGVRYYTGTTPFTWATGDTLFGNCMYRPA
jgi:hypothetical protein